MGEREPRTALEYQKDLYSRRLSPEEADAHYAEVLEAFDSARRNPYTSFMGRLRHQLAPEHLERMIDVYGIILPLGMQQAVLEGQTAQATAQNIHRIMSQINIFLSQFSNTGVKLLTPLPREVIEQAMKPSS